MLEPARKHAQELAQPGFYAEFATDKGAVAAARRLIADGHPVLDAFTPRPVVELEELVAPARSNLNRTVFFGGLLGACTGLGIEWACNAWDYPLNTGGRPPFALPAYIPITFEAMVLFAAFAAFFGFMHRAGLPWLAHPAFEVPGFERASIDRFFLLVERRRGGDDELAALLEELGAVSVVKTPLDQVQSGAPAPTDPGVPPAAPPSEEPAE
jgi:hypothetical protein